LNKNIADEYGFFWVVTEIKLLECSCVLFGANEITPTLEVKHNTQHEPDESTQSEPPKFDLKEALKGIKFFKN
jgi:hypothetical protein